MNTIIDSYSEYILNAEHKAGEKIGTLPNGVSREDWLKTLDVLIRETFPEVTAYSQAEYRTGKVILLLIQKYCLSDKVFGSIKKGQTLIDYTAATADMLTQELNRMNAASNGFMPVLDAEKAFTIIANTMQILTTVMEAKEKTPQGGAADQPAIFGIKLPFGAPAPAGPTIEMARESTAIGDVVSYLDTNWEFTKNLQRFKTTPKFQGDAIMEWMEFKYLRMILQITRMRLDEMEVF